MRNKRQGEEGMEIALNNLPNITAWEYFGILRVFLFSHMICMDMCFTGMVIMPPNIWHNVYCMVWTQSVLDYYTLMLQ